MRCMFALLFVIVSLPAAAAEVFTWKDEQGRTHFGSRPPGTLDSATTQQVEPPPPIGSRRSYQSYGDSTRGYRGGNSGSYGGSRQAGHGPTQCAMAANNARRQMTDLERQLRELERGDAARRAEAAEVRGRLTTAIARLDSVNFQTECERDYAAGNTRTTDCLAGAGRSLLHCF
ncbi:MAG: DUF4124 domain-containing protein [Moraxellaceae bacterium]